MNSIWMIAGALITLYVYISCITLTAKHSQRFSQRLQQDLACHTWPDASGPKTQDLGPCPVPCLLPDLSQRDLQAKPSLADQIMSQYLEKV